MMFPTNCWYAAAFDHEVTQKPFALVILNEPLVFFRRENGSVAALRDRCAHRMLPLSLGRVSGDNIQCRYHGFTYDSGGKCVWAPGQAAPPNSNIRAYPVIERRHLIWVWIGDEALADSSQIVDEVFAGLGEPGWNFKGERLFVEAGYQLLIDNLMDMLHLGYLHRGTIGSEAIRQGKFETRLERPSGAIQVSRWIPNHLPSPTSARGQKTSEENSAPVLDPEDAWHVATFGPPCNVRIDAGSAPVGAIQTPREALHLPAGFANINALTPATAGATHYLWINIDSYNDLRFTERVFEEVRATFQEDIEVLEAQQRSLDSLAPAESLSSGWSCNLQIDAAGIKARRTIELMLARDREVSERRVAENGDATHEGRISRSL
jgi:phenylpropionate dioxygenase-like ring-hydroxylating dioxygenase large terminal subunit